MCDELNEWIEEGNKLMKDIVEHFEQSGADRSSTPISTNNGCYIVEIRKTF